MIDGSTIRAHRHAAGAKGGQDKQALGRSCGGFSSKIHAKVEAFGLPLGFVVTAGQSSEIKEAEALVGEDFCEYLLADRGYDSDPFRQALTAKKIIPVIPGRKNRLEKVKYDGRGRNCPCEQPPAQIPAGRITALGSYLGYITCTRQYLI